LAGLTVDSGFLIALDHDERGAWAFWFSALNDGVQVTVPAPVVAQVWRGSRNARVAMALNASHVEPLSALDARAVGELLGRSNTADITDACVVLSAGRRSDAIVTSDVGDIRRLVEFVPSVGQIIDVARIPRP